MLSALLKEPARLSFELGEGRGVAVLGQLAALLVVALAAYGVVVGTFSGGDQLFLAPAKILLGSFAAALICLPSLYVFLCLSGADARWLPVAGLLAATVALTAVLLVSLAPIAGIFSQSTESIAFMGALHLALWLVAVAFGLRLLARAAGVLWGAADRKLVLWCGMYLLVCLQMMTSLRPILGTADAFLPAEKQFFVAHWLRVLGTE